MCRVEDPSPEPQPLHSCLQTLCCTFTYPPLSGPTPRGGGDGDRCVEGPLNFHWAEGGVPRTYLFAQV